MGTNWPLNLSKFSVVRPISFYPGPSRIESKIPKYIAQGYESGILSMNHRSQPFMDMVNDTNQILKTRLGIPKDYSIYYVSSATECWEIITQSISKSSGSYHLHNGAFGEKWYNYAKAISEEALAHDYDPQTMIPLPEEHLIGRSVVCITQNETSNGSRIDPNTIDEFHDHYPDNLIAVDATSSMAGIDLNFSKADIWFASVQKCFGLPSGMAVLVCSPRVLERAMEVGEKNHYNSLLSIDKNMQKLQTTHTPNILAIYLLNRVMSKRKSINKIAKRTKKRSEEWAGFFEGSKKIQYYIEDPELRSQTVLAMKADPGFISNLKEKALEKSLIIGNGYGSLKDSTFRIANFPALKKKEIKYLREFLYPLI